MLGVAELAAAVATAIAPYVPKILEGGKKLTAEAAKKFAGKAGEAAWTRISALWGQLTPAVAGDKKVEGAMIALSADTTDEDSIKVFAKSLLVHLEKDAALRESLTKLLGGQDSIQKVIAKDSIVKNVVQSLSGKGSQSVEADRSIVEGVKQINK